MTHSEDELCAAQHVVDDQVLFQRVHVLCHRGVSELGGRGREERRERGRVGGREGGEREGGRKRGRDEGCKKWEVILPWQHTMSASLMM